MKEQIRILSTKKLLPNQKQFLLNAGFSLTEADLIKVDSKKFEHSSTHDNLIFTSSNAVKSAVEYKIQLIEKPCFCVGSKTRLLLETNGFEVKASADNAEDLGKIIIDHYSNESFSFLTGNLTLHTLPEMLRNANIKFETTEVYETTLSPMKLNSTFDGVLFFSPSAVESFLQQNKITTETCFCIGNTTAKALQNITDNIIIANQPSIENTIIQTINHFKKA